MTRIVRLLVMLVAMPLAGAADESSAPAGPAELVQVEQQIAVMEGALHGILARETANHAQALAMAAERLESEVTGYTDRVYPPAPSIEHLGEWYVQAARQRSGFDVFEPSSPWQHRWIDLRTEDHHLQDDEEGARVALRHLRVLRDRLRAQLGLPAVPAGS